MTNGVRPALPIELAAIKEVPQGVASELNVYCLLHGKKAGASCDECDRHFPEAVAARAGAAAQPTGFSMDQVQAMIGVAVDQAFKERDAFEKWKVSPEGQAAANVAKTANAAPPDHAAQATDVKSVPVPVSSVPTRDEWVAAGYPEAQYDAFVARFAKPVA